MPKKGGKKKKKQNDGSEDLKQGFSEVLHPKELQVNFHGVQQSFTEYTRQFTRRYFPDFGTKAIMVPPLTFHKNWEIVDKETTKKLTERLGKHVQVPAKDESTLRSAEAEHRVALTFKRLADDRGWKIAVIVCPKFENYLTKIKKGKFAAKVANTVLEGTI